MEDKSSHKLWAQVLDEPLPKRDGLLEGKMGHILSILLVYDSSNLKKHKEYADSLLDDLSENLNKMNDNDFENGFAGIAWTIEWLNHSKILSFDTDEVLCELDNSIYIELIRRKTWNLSLNDGLLGYLIYFTIRYPSQNAKSDRLANVYMLDCITMLLAKIEQCITTEVLKMPKSDKLSTHLKHIGGLFIFISYFSKRKINSSICKSILIQLYSYIKKHLNFKIAKKVELSEIAQVAYLNLCLKLGAIGTRNRAWKTEAENLNYTLGKCNIKEPILADGYQMLRLYNYVFSERKYESFIFATNNMLDNTIIDRSSNKTELDIFDIHLLMLVNR